MTVKSSKPLWTRQEKSLLMTLWLEGKSNREIAEVMERTELAVVTKLSRMGMLRPNKNGPVKTVPRPCLACGEVFPSTDPFNRICRECKKKADWDDSGMTIRLGRSRGE